MASTRFPGKPLAAETGRAMVLHVVDRARAASLVDRVIVTAPDQLIVEAVQADGGEAMLTSEDHPNGTSRLAEVVDRLGDDLDPDSIVVNVQGDEPEIDPKAIDAVINVLESDPGADMATIAAPWDPTDDPEDPSIVKVVLSSRGRALYFSRSRIPFVRDTPASEVPPAGLLRHVGLYAYRAAFLPRFAAWAESPLELLERLEQLRVLENGGTIAVAVHATHGTGIDTPEQYQAFVARWTANRP
jgi:3-deoxy-manno-octulosonate cytidylyltransferase (CMP-KDO synthetase)